MGDFQDFSLFGESFGCPVFKLRKLKCTSDEPESLSLEDASRVSRHYTSPREMVKGTRVTPIAL